MKRILTTLKQKWPEYLLEILVIMIGILGAYSLNNWNESKKQEAVKSTYVESLLADLTKDIDLISDDLSHNRDHLENIEFILLRIRNSQKSYADTILKIIPNEFSNGIRAIINYNTNTLNLLISSGSIDLFDETLISELMELNRLQQYEREVTSTNKGLFHDLIDHYLTKYPNPHIADITSSEIEQLIWENVDSSDLVVIFFNAISQQRHTIKRHIFLTEQVESKTTELIQLLKNNKY